LALVAVFAFSAVAVASASAKEPRWKVGGAFLGSGVAEAFTSTSGASKLRVPARSLVLNCKKDSGTGKIVGSAEGSAGTNKEVVVTFEECSVEGAAACVVPNIKTAKLKSELVWLAKTGNAAGDRLTPESGEVFTTILIEGCAAEGTFPVKGEALGEALPDGTEASPGTLKFLDPAITKYFTGTTKKEEEEGKARTEHANKGLTFGGAEAVFSSTDSVTLTSKKSIRSF